MSNSIYLLIGICWGMILGLYISRWTIQKWLRERNTWHCAACGASNPQWRNDCFYCAGDRRVTLNDR